jgi:hypothetical protein
VGAQRVLQPAGVRVGYVDVEPCQKPSLPHRRRLHPRSYGVGVGAHQAIRAEEHPAEVPADHRDDINERATAQYLEHRRTRRARRLAVVAGALEVTRRAEHERRAVVPGVPVLPALLLDHGPRRLLRGHRLDAAPEP